MKALPIQMQIEVLESARASLIKDSKPLHYPLGLCFYILESIENTTRTWVEVKSFDYSELEKYISLFTKANAEKFGASMDKNKMYWWPLCQLKPRFEFLDWMISELKKEIYEQ